MKVLNTELLFVGFGLLLACTFAGNSMADIDPASVAGIWLFDEAQGGIAWDASLNENHGEFSKPDSLTWTDGVFDGALQFQGAEYVGVPHSPSLDMADTISIVMWMRLDAIGRYPGLIYKGEVGQEAYWGIHQNPSGVVYARIDTTGGDNQNGGNIENVSDGEWHHIVFIFDEGVAQLYRDGEALPEKPYNHGDGFWNAKELGIGSGFYPQDPRDLDGVIDEVGVFRVVLTAEDVQNIMESGFRSLGFSRAVNTSGKLSTTWARLRGEESHL